MNTVFNSLKEDGNFIVHFLREARTAVNCHIDDLQGLWDAHKKGGPNYHEASGLLLFEQDVIELMDMLLEAQTGIDEAMAGLVCGCDSCGEARMNRDAERAFESQFEEECHEIYVKDGQDAVIAYSQTYGDKEGVVWKECEPCELVSPTLDDNCLVCGSIVE